MKKISIILSLMLMLIITSCGKQEVILQEESNISEAELADGEYKAEVTLEGGTGKASLISPTDIIVKGGKCQAIIVFTSKNYDYMIVNDIKYLNENNGGESTFTIPVENIDEPLNVIADTVAMSTPHEIEYQITFKLVE